ncbi:hypothetical protein ACWEXP_01010 [Staphylococcus pseudoxylosus]|uniref:hypothetical protein n=1 Tax=Staphylococcus pseudoxylosus TaxID=2282419 RepID=UPI001F2CC1CE|nr:hypothetical protein [Staphylococcus pseudoxylosus]
MLSADGTKDIERRVGILEDKDRYNDKRLRKIEEAQKEDRKNFQNSIEKLYDSLKEIERGQHTQELTNQKMDFTLDSINKEREDNKKLLNKLTWLIISGIFTIVTSIVYAAIRMWLGL